MRTGEKVMKIIRDYWGDIRIIWSKSKLTEKQCKAFGDRPYVTIFDYRFGFGYMFKV